MKFTVEFYETIEGKSPVRDFLESLEPKMRAKTVAMLELLQDKGNELRMPYSRHLEKGIFELRCKLGSNITRTLYFFYEGATIILTNGFVKKTMKTPRIEIERAELYRTDYLKRKEHQQ